MLLESKDGNNPFSTNMACAWDKSYILCFFTEKYAFLFHTVCKLTVT